MSWIKNTIFRFLGVQRAHSLVFFAAFCIVSLINVNYCILRSVRNTLAVSLSTVGAELIPAIQFWLLMPLTLLMVWGIGALMRRHRLSSVFSIATLFFVSFFLIYATLVFPYRATLHDLLTFAWLKETIPSLAHLTENWTLALYYVMAELWKVAVLSVLFFGFLNRRLSLETAKGLYSPILLGGSLGGLMAGPVTVFCSDMGSWLSTSFGFDKWQSSFVMLSVAVALVGGLIVLAFEWLKRRLKSPELDNIEVEKKRDKPLTITLFESFKTILRSRYLLSLCLMVIFEYVAYYLYEIFFLDLLKRVCPDPNSYCSYNGQLVFWSSLLTIFSAMFVTPFLVKRCSWKVPALISPAIVLILSMAFFGTAIFHDSAFIGNLAVSFGLVPMQLALMIGAVFFCVARAAKNTVFDVSKELAFIPLTAEMQSKGKLVVDGLASRTGCCMAAAINQVLFSTFSTIEAGMPSAAMLSLGAVIVWIRGVMNIEKTLRKKDSGVALSEMA